MVTLRTWPDPLHVLQVCTEFLSFGATAVAMLAAYVLLYFYFLVGSVGYFVEVHLQLYAQVRPARALPAATAAALAAEHIAKHIVAENVAEILEDVFHAHTAGTALAVSAALAAHACMTKTIVLSAFVGVAQRIICLSRFFKLLLRFLVTRVAVGVVLKCYFAIGFFDLIGSGALCNAQYFVIISFSHTLNP